VDPTEPRISVRLGKYRRPLPVAFAGDGIRRWRGWRTWGAEERGGAEERRGGPSTPAAASHSAALRGQVSAQDAGGAEGMASKGGREKGCDTAGRSAVAAARRGTGRTGSPRRMRRGWAPGCMASYTRLNRMRATPATGIGRRGGLFALGNQPVYRVFVFAPVDVLYRPVHRIRCAVSYLEQFEPWNGPAP
jgi:hypothetical protein